MYFCPIITKNFTIIVDAMCVVGSEAGEQFSGLRLKPSRQARLHPTLLVAQKKVFIKTILRCAHRPLVLFILPFE